MSSIKKLVASIEKSKLGAQAFRVVRIAVVAIAGTVATGNPVTGGVIVAAFEAAFRQVFPAV